MRHKHYKISNKSRLRLLKFVLLSVLILLIALTVGIDNRLRIVVNNYAKNKATIVANNVVNTTVEKYLNEKEIKYTDLVIINEGTDGKINSVQFNSVEISKLKSSVVSKIQNEISNNRNVKIAIPSGTLTGSQFFNNRGPRINLTFEMSSAIYSKISSTFVSAGINQTLHRIILDINADIYFVMPWYKTKGGYETEFVLAETIIVGEVPDAYTNVIEYPGSDMAGLLFDYGAGDN